MTDMSKRGLRAWIIAIAVAASVAFPPLLVIGLPVVVIMLLIGQRRRQQIRNHQQWANRKKAHDDLISAVRSA